MKLFICIILLSSFLFGCNHRTKLAFEMIKWQNREISIPQNLQAFIYGKDTIVNYHNSNYNILNYIGTSNCTECHMQLLEWKILKEEIEKSNANIGLIFIVYTKDYDKIEYLQKVNGFNYPIFYDYTDTVNKINNFSKNKNLHTFLIDSTNKVKLIGNPLKSKKLLETYKKYIANELK